MDPFTRRKERVEHLVVDAGGFIKNVAIQNLGQKIYTIPEVIAEIRDRATKERLAVLPYEIQYREPPVELIKIVSDFAKKTGDYANLSAVDIKVIALTLLLEKENVGMDHIHQQPIRSQTIIHKTVPSTVGGEVRQAANTPGFFVPKDQLPSNLTRHSRINSESEQTPIRPVLEPSLDKTEKVEAKEDEDEESDLWEEDLDQTNDLTECMEAVTLTGSQAEEDSETKLRTGTGSDGGPLEESAESEVDSDDDAGWITPQNVKAVYKQLGLEKEEPTEKNKVGCLTSDFSVQNVIMQMGMHVIGADGMMIKTLRNYVFRCFACYRITHDMTKQFCFSCGNRTLKRVCVTVDKNGQPKYHISTRRPLNIRGTKFSLPMPKGGKHAVNPILCEDQPQPQFRAAKKALQKLNVFDPDYVAGNSPFLMNDLTSKASLLGRRGENTFCEMQPWMAKNPNACRRPRK